MQSIEAEGQSIDDAIQRALQRLGVSRDKVDIEIVSNASRGLFGLGGRPAKVRATVRRSISMPQRTRRPAMRRWTCRGELTRPPARRLAPFATMRRVAPKARARSLP